MSTDPLLPSVGYRGSLGIGLETTKGSEASLTLYPEIESETLQKGQEYLDVPGLHGQRSRVKTERIQTVKNPRGGIIIPKLKPTEASFFLQWILGDYGSGSGWLTADLPTATVIVDKVLRRMKFLGCMVNTAEFSSSATAQPLRLALELIAMSSSDTSDALTPSYTDETPFLHRHVTLTVGTDAVLVQELNIKVEHQLDDQAYRNSVTRVSIYPQGDRIVNGRFSCDWNAANDHIWTKFTNHTAAQLEAVYSNGVHTLIFRMPNAYYPAETPQLAGRQTLMLPVPFEAQASAPGTNDELEVFYS